MYQTSSQRWAAIRRKEQEFNGEVQFVVPTRINGATTRTASAEIAATGIIDGTLRLATEDEIKAFKEVDAERAKALKMAESARLSKTVLVRQ